MGLQPLAQVWHQLIFVYCYMLLDLKTPLPEDSDLECFLPVNKALRFAAVPTTTNATYHPGCTLWTEKTHQIFWYTVYKNWPIMIKFVTFDLSKFVMQNCKRFPPHLNSVLCPTLWNLAFTFCKWIAVRTVNRKNTPKCFCHIFYKTRPILIKFGTCFPD